jgi:hypothetical protein
MWEVGPTASPQSDGRSWPTTLEAHLQTTPNWTVVVTVPGKGRYESDRGESVLALGTLVDLFPRFRNTRRKLPFCWFEGRPVSFLGVDVFPSAQLAVFPGRVLGKRYMVRTTRNCALPLIIRA